MKSALKNAALGLTVIAVASFFLIRSFTTEIPTIEKCFTTTITVVKVLDGNPNEIRIEASYGEQFYIDTSQQQEINIETLASQILHKKVTLYLPKLIMGHSKQIAQLETQGAVIFTVF